MIEARVDRTRLTLFGPEGARAYPLPQREHSAWLDLFRHIAADFGTRLPRAREPWATAAREPAIRPLLTEPVAPGIRDGYGDPAVLRTPEGWHLVVTSNDAPDAFPLLFSPDLEHWEHRGFVFPEGRTPAWALTGEGEADFWAPELHRVGEAYWLVFTARNHARELCIGLARAPSPDGPFVADSEPLLTGGTIDAHLCVRGPDEVLLFWKEDRNAVWPRLLATRLHADPGLADRLFDDGADRRTTHLCASLWRWAATATPMEQFFALQPLIESVVARYDSVRARLGDHPDVVAAMCTPVLARRLAPDGRALLGEPRTVLVNDLAWEGHLIEGNWVTAQAGRYWLFYAGNDFSTPDYGIGVAVADDPLGPYAKQTEPLLRTTADWWGPGHPSVAPGPDGAPHLFFHAFKPGTGGYKVFRALLTAKLRFEGERVRLAER